jgi:hypothetical protein
VFDFSGDRMFGACRAALSLRRLGERSHDHASEGKARSERQGTTDLV